MNQSVKEMKNETGDRVNLLQHFQTSNNNNYSIPTNQRYGNSTLMAKNKRTMDRMQAKNNFSSMKMTNFLDSSIRDKRNSMGTSQG